MFCAPFNSVAAEVMRPTSSIAAEVMRPTSSVAAEVMRPTLPVAAEVMRPTSSIAAEVMRPKKQPAANLPICLSALAISLMATACGFEMQTPENFVKVESTRAVFRALSPQQDRLLVRHFALHEKSNLAFWIESLNNHLTENLGYSIKEAGEFKTEAGLVGHRFLIETAIEDVPYSYQLVVFSTQGWFRQHIYTAELLCAKKNFDKYGPAVEAALLRFRIE